MKAERQPCQNLGFFGPVGSAKALMRLRLSKNFLRPTYDFSVLPQLSKPKVLELSRCEWIEHKHNCCLVGSHGTGKTHIAVALGQAACRAGLRVLFFTAAELVSKLEAAKKQYTLDRFLGQLERAQLLICDELGYVSLSRGGVELLFRVFSDRYEPPACW